MASNIYSYSNSYEPFSKECIVDDSPSIPTRIYELCLKEKQRLTDTPYTEHDQFCRPIIMRCTEGRPILPIDPDVYDEDETPIRGKEEIYLYVYGRRPIVALEFKDQAKAWHYADPKSLRKLINMLRDDNVASVVDAKLVYKRPYTHAAAGPRYMVQLYFGGAQTPEHWRLRELLNGGNLELSTIFTKALHHSSVSPHTQWYITNRAPIHGEIHLLSPINSYRMKPSDKFLVGTAYYKDIRFVHDELLVIHSKDADAYTETLVKHYERVIKSTEDEAISAVLMARLKNVRVPHGNECDWYGFKKHALYPAFLTGSANTPYTQLTTALTEAVRDLPEWPRFSTHDRTREGLSWAVSEICRLYSEMRKEAKQFWRHEVRAKHLSEQQIRIKEQRLVLHTIVMRWAMTDIEVTYVPHCRDEDSIEINLITLVIFDHAHTIPSDAVAFMLVAKERQDGGTNELEATNLNREKIVEKALTGLQFPNISGCFHIRYFVQERKLLASFLDYVRDGRLHVIGYYNGHKFDLPFIVARLSYLNMTDYLKKIPKWQSKENRPKTIALSLTHRRDVGTIQYRPKIPKKNHRAHGVEMYAQSIEQIRDESRELVQEYIDADYSGDGPFEDRYIDELEMNKTMEYIPIPSVQACITAEDDGIETSNRTYSSKISSFMVPARQITSISMNNVALLDVMLEVGDRNRGCKLDVASKTWLNVGKLHDDRVSYENLTETWRFGDRDGLETLVAYCLRDTILTLMLAKHKQISSFYMGDSALSYMNFRELFLAQMVKSTIATQCGYGHCQNVLMPDTTLIRDERPLWVPGYKFVAERDFEKLSPLAGRTVQNSGFYDVPMVTFDFSQQYPSIKRAYNVCSTTWITTRQSQKLNSKYYDEKVVVNVRPVVEHVCAKYGLDCQGRLEKNGDPRLCRYETYYERVSTTLRYSKSNFFRGLVPQSLEDLAVLRKEYKRLMNAAKKTADKDLYNALQLAVKSRMNSAYGVALRLTPLVGATVTQYGREQTERVAEKARDELMMTSNGDTDSIMVLDNAVCLGEEELGRLSAMSRNLCNGQSRVPISTIVKNMMEKYERFCCEANATLHPSPCSLELEKVFIFQRMDEKKCYLGEKILPGSLALKPHRAGLTGMKGDKTEVKAASQFIPGKMAGNRDVDGLVLYARHLYDIVSIRLRAHEIAQLIVDDLCDKIDLEVEDMFRDAVVADDDTTKTVYVPPWKKSVEVGALRSAVAISREARDELARFDADRGQEKVEAAHCNGDVFPFEWMTSTEKVGDVANPVTIATKVAIRQCKRNGVDKHTAPLFVNTARKHEVQVSAPLIKSLEVLLRAPEKAEWCTHRERIEEEELGKKEWDRVRKRRRQKEAAASAKKNTVTKLSITKMPDHLVAPPSNRAQFSERERAELYDVVKYIKRRDVITQTERKTKFTNLTLVKPPRLTEYQTLRLRMYIEKFQPAGLHAPLWWYDEHYCESHLEGVDHWHNLPHPQSACDLWLMYIHSGMKRRYLHVKGGLCAWVKASDQPIEGAFTFDCDDCSWDKENVHELEMSNVENPRIFTLDMRERYARQTRTTPFIITSVDGIIRYLTNRDSYCPNRPNRFSFAVHLAQLMNMSRTMATQENGVDALISFRPVINTGDVRVRGRFSGMDLKDVYILRDDKRRSSSWFWNDDEVFIRRNNLQAILTRLNMRATSNERLKTVEVRFDDDIMSVQCSVDVKKYTVPCSTSAERVPSLTVPVNPNPDHTNSILLPQGRKRAAHTSGRRCSKRGKHSAKGTDVKPNRQTTLISFLTLTPSPSSNIRCRDSIQFD